MSDGKLMHLKAQDGTTIVSLPAYRSLYEVPLNRYIDFLKAREPLDNTAAIEAGDVNVVRVVAQAVGAFCGVELDRVLEAHFGNFEESEAADKNLSQLYAWILNLLTTFTPKIRTPEDALFEYRGENWKIPVIGIQALAAMPALPDVETGEAVEAYEVQRTAQLKREKDGDPDGSVLYSYYLRLLAVICRKDDGQDKLPISESECERYINERSVHFREIDAGTALDVDFFLAGLMRPSEQTRAAVGSLANPIFALAVQTVRRQRRNGKPLTGRSSTRRKFSRELGGAKPTLSSLKGLGSRKPAKVRSKA